MNTSIEIDEDYWKEVGLEVDFDKQFKYHVESTMRRNIIKDLTILKPKLMNKNNYKEN